MAFDPYWEWLRIPPEKRPPDFYALLALAPFESDAEKIRSAGLARTARVRRYCLGPHGAEATKLLGELAAAFSCLEDPSRKQAYDESLQAETSSVGKLTSVAKPTVGQEAPPPIRRAIPLASGSVAETVDPSPAASRRRRGRRRAGVRSARLAARRRARRRSVAQKLALLAAGCALLIAAIAVAASFKQATLDPAKAFASNPAAPASEARSSDQATATPAPAEPQTPAPLAASKVGPSIVEPTPAVATPNVAKNPERRDNLKPPDASEAVTRAESKTPAMPPRGVAESTHLPAGEPEPKPAPTPKSFSKTSPAAAPSRPMAASRNDFAAQRAQREAEAEQRFEERKERERTERAQRQAEAKQRFEELKQRQRDESVKSNLQTGEIALQDGNFAFALRELTLAIKTADFQLTDDTERAERLLQTALRNVSAKLGRNKPPQAVLDAREVLKEFRERVKQQKRRSADKR